MPPRSYASQGGRIGISRSNRDQENLPLMRFSSIIYGRQEAHRWDTTEGYYRIQPELGRGPTCTLIQRYLLGCIRDGVTDNDEIQERYEAAATLHVWFRHLAEMDGTHEVLKAAANGLMKLYLEGVEEVRMAIETGFLEHALETAALRPYFEQWGSDPRLEPAWKRALEWGEAHPDYMAGLFQRLQGKTKNEG